MAKCYFRCFLTIKKWILLPCYYWHWKVMIVCGKKKPKTLFNHKLPVNWRLYREQKTLSGLMIPSQHGAALSCVTEKWRSCRNSQGGEAGGIGRSFWQWKGSWRSFPPEGCWGQCLVVLFMLNAPGNNPMFGNVWRKWNVFERRRYLHHQLIYSVACLY